jgi:hypothetical protein
LLGHAYTLARHDDTLHPVIDVRAVRLRRLPCGYRRRPAVVRQKGDGRIWSEAALFPGDDGQYADEVSTELRHEVAEERRGGFVGHLAIVGEDIR